MCLQDRLAEPGQPGAVWDPDRGPDLHPGRHLRVHGSQHPVRQGQALPSHAGNQPNYS